MLTNDKTPLTKSGIKLDNTTSTRHGAEHKKAMK